MSDVPVCVIGCGPIGLAISLLLSRHGVPVLLVERRSELNTHPRSRFVDTNTMELMRELDIEKPPEGVLIFQPLDGVRRWRCQVSTGQPDLISQDAIRTRIRASLGTTDDVVTERHADYLAHLFVP